MKKIILVSMLIYISGTLLAQRSSQPFMTRSLTGQSIKDVEVETSGGNITVESAGTGQARVEVFIVPSNRNNGAVAKEEIQERLDKYYDLKIDIGDNKVFVSAKRKSKKWDRKASLAVSFKIFVAESVSTHLVTSGGNIVLNNISGKQDITTSGGNLVINKVKGNLKGITSGGNIVVKDAVDDINLATSGGNIEAENCNGKIKLVTSGGSIRLTNMTGNTEAITSGGNVRADVVSGELLASTSGGNIDLKGLSCNVTTSTSAGNIRVAVKEPGKFIKIKNSGGEIELQLPADKGYNLDLSASKIKTNNLTNFNGKTSDDEINGKLNGGGSTVTVEGGDGRISLMLK